MPIRFSIAALMAVVLVLAVGFAGLRAATLLWASALFSTAPFTGRHVNLLHFRRIGHTLAAIIFALLGSVVGALFASRRPAEDGGHPSSAHVTAGEAQL
jgi:hypothetical protein